VKFLHTSDWHVGKTLKGHSRLDEQEAVLTEIVGLAEKHQVDAVLISGDLYDAAAPGADAQRILIKTLLALADSGSQVVAMAGNHDSPGMLDAYRPLAGHAGITLPFLSQRWAIRAADLLTQTPAEAASSYDQQIRELLTHLKTGFTTGAVNLVMAHLTVSGAVLGGGERTAQTIFEYWVPASAFGTEPHYVALGHLHRRQTLPAGCPVAYCGSPICVDFGEQDNTPVVVLVEATPSTPAHTTDLPLVAGRRLRTVRGTVAALAARAEELGDAFLRVYVTEPARAGMRDDVLAVLPNALEIRIDPEFAETASANRAAPRPDRSPSELFGDYCAQKGVDDIRVQALFDQLHDAVTSATDATLDIGTGA